LSLGWKLKVQFLFPAPPAQPNNDIRGLERMTQSLPEIKTYTIDEFIDWYPEHSINRYELHRGTIIEMPPPTGKHEDVIAFLNIFLAVLLSQIDSKYKIHQKAFVQVSNGTLYNPDILIQDSSNIKNEPEWSKRPILSQPESVPLVIEVVSTNWQDDYHHKLADYEKMGIPEYWIVDFDAYGGRKFIGNPKQPTLFICELTDGEYQMKKFRDNDQIISPFLGETNLTAQTIFDVATN
jgi:Uma2 family endonuclease